MRSTCPLSIEDTFQIAARARNAILLADTTVVHNNNVFLGEITCGYVMYSALILIVSIFILKSYS